MHMALALALVVLNFKIVYLEIEIQFPYVLSLPGSSPLRTELPNGVIEILKIAIVDQDMIFEDLMDTKVAIRAVSARINL